MTSSTVTGSPSENLAFGIEGELDPAPVCRRLDRFRQQAIEGEGFVGAARQEALDDEIAEDRVAEAARRGRAALDDEGVHAVVGADDAIGDLAALRRVRIGIGKVLEVRRQRRARRSLRCRASGSAAASCGTRPRPRVAAIGRGDLTFQGDGDDGCGHGRLAIGFCWDSKNEEVVYRSTARSFEDRRGHFRRILASKLEIGSQPG